MWYECLRQLMAKVSESRKVIWDLKVILHQVEFSSWLNGWSPERAPGLLSKGQWCWRYQMVSFFNRGPKRGVDLDQNGNQLKEIATNWTGHQHCGDGSLGMNQSTKKPVKPQNMLIKMRGPVRPLYAIAVIQPASVLSPHAAPIWLLFLTEEKKIAFCLAWASMTPPTLALYGLAQRLVSRGGLLVLIYPRPRRPSSIFGPVSLPRPLAYMHPKAVCLELTWWATWKGWQSTHEMQGHKIIAHCLNRIKIPHCLSKGLGQITVLRGGRGIWIYSC